MNLPREFVRMPDRCPGRSTGIPTALRRPTAKTATFDYGVPAELFMAKRKTRQPLTYHRFATAAEAIRFTGRLDAGR